MLFLELQPEKCNKLQSGTRNGTKQKSGCGAPKSSGFYCVFCVLFGVFLRKIHGVSSKGLHQIGANVLIGSVTLHKVFQGFLQWN